MELYQFFWLNQQKEHLTEMIQNAKNLTFGSGTANTAPAHPLRRGPQYFSDFFAKLFIVSRSALLYDVPPFFSLNENGS